MELFFFASHVYFYFKPLGYLVSVSWPSGLCKAWTPSLGMGLRLNQTFVGHSHKFCVLFAPVHLASKTSKSWRGCNYDDSFACAWDSFPPIRLPYPASIWGLSRLVLSSIVLKVCYLLETCSFLKRKGRGSGSRRNGRCIGELGRVKRGETVVRMSCMREKSIFNWKKKERKLLWAFTL